MKTRRILLALVVGWVVPQAARADFVATASLSGANERPNPNASTATGRATFTFLTTSQSIQYDVLYSNLSAPPTAGHIHFGPASAAGPVILPFGNVPTTTSGELTGTLTVANLINQGTSGITTFAQIVDAAQAGNLYTNLHDANYPAGEIRGQLSPVPEPSSVTLTGMGLAGLAWSRRRRGNEGR